MRSTLAALARDCYEMKPSDRDGNQLRYLRDTIQKTKELFAAAASKKSSKTTLRIPSPSYIYLATEDSVSRDATAQVGEYLHKSASLYQRGPSREGVRSVWMLQGHFGALVAALIVF